MGGRSNRALEVAALCFAALGAVVAAWGDGPIFAVWREAGIRAVHGGQAPAHWAGFASVTFGMLGGSIAGKWLAAWWIAAVPLRRGEAWARPALWWGLASWFVIDSALSAAHGAWFNVWMINLAPVAVFAPLLARAPAGTRAPAPVPTVAWRVVLAACVLSVVAGLAIAFAVDTALFAMWRAGAATQLGQPTLDPELRAWLAFVAGPIGATTVGHFVMLAWIARHAAGQRWALAAIASSVGVWFAIDTTSSLVRGAAFNVWLVNVPAFALMAIPCVFAARRGRPTRG